MPYNGQVIFDGKRGVELAQEHLRHALADEILARLLREDRDRAFLDVRDLPRAGLDELLGEFWLAYGWRERRRLARAVDWRLAIVREVLQSVGHGCRRSAPGSSRSIWGRARSPRRPSRHTAGPGRPPASARRGVATT